MLLIFTSLIHLVHLLLKSYCQSCPKPVVRQLVFNLSKYKLEFLLILVVEFVGFCLFEGTICCHRYFFGNTEYDYGNFL